MRPKKIRWVGCKPGNRYFIPQKPSGSEIKKVHLTVDELEAIRIYDLEGLSQIEVSEAMKVHRSTISRILKSAHKKIADALVNVKSIGIDGGCCKFIDK